MPLTLPRALTLSMTSAATAVLVAGCGSGTDYAKLRVEASPKAPASATAPATAQAAATATATASIEPPGGDFAQQLTPPGTALAVGEAAYVEVESGSEEEPESWSRAIVKVTVTEVRRGSPDDFAGTRGNLDVRGYTPYYVESESQIVAFEGSLTRLPTVRLDPAGPGQITTLLASNFTKCRSTGYLTPGAGVGNRNQQCHLMGGVGDGVVTGAEYSGNDTSSDYYKEPLTWGPGKS